ncbi:hypothetical protein [Planktothricoides raciborskii]|uniref:Uncharacterized protein n=1 Tax=Planktothricoides raciborskii FACHB-1370 TaxID=2949576 RepID=A0ABR8EJZ2_9CYAN|nr:hypothetical protein [Planktothricoides raciborskii]MBD2546208.1 hypothetical protein [Planktothricoides raciborskii FACHB-1370]MBD2584481.1 hypothetical protein [Planktothricoides raciborskii FACHB-1261]
MKFTTTINAGLAIVIGATVGMVNISSILHSGKITEVAIAHDRYPGVDENGDYYIIGGEGGSYMPYVWEVVDPDPNGLNCRLMNRRQSNGTNGSGRDIYNFPVSHRFLAGEELPSAGINLDDRGLPWVWVGTSATTSICFVRANTKFVRPVRPLERM